MKDNGERESTGWRESNLFSGVIFKVIKLQAVEALSYLYQHVRGLYYGHAAQNINGSA